MLLLLSIHELIESSHNQTNDSNEPEHLKQKPETGTKMTAPTQAIKCRHDIAMVILLSIDIVDIWKWQYSCKQVRHKQEDSINVVYHGMS